MLAYRVSKDTYQEDCQSDDFTGLMLNQPLEYETSLCWCCQADPMQLMAVAQPTLYITTLSSAQWWTVAVAAADSLVSWQENVQILTLPVCDGVVLCATTMSDTLKPRAGSEVVRIDPLHFLAGCRKKRLNQALSVLSLSLGFI